MLRGSTPAQFMRQTPQFMHSGLFKRRIWMQFYIVKNKNNKRNKKIKQ